MGVIDWGDAPTWFGTGFAALAAAGAIWTVASQRKQIGEQRAFIAEQSANLRLERAALQAAADDRREKQARSVRLDVDRNYVYVFNESDAPIRKVRCSDASTSLSRSCVVDGKGNAAAELMAALARGADLGPAVDLVGVGQAAVFHRIVNGARETVTVSFTDSDGIEWHRDDLGALR